MTRLLWASALTITLTAVSVQAQDASMLLVPDANLKVDGMPDLPASMVDKVAAYTKLRGHGFARKVNADYYFYATVQFLETTLLK